MLKDAYYEFAILVDMLLFAIDHPPPATVVIITADVDISYCSSTLKLRGYTVVLITTNERPATHPLPQTNAVFDFRTILLPEKPGEVDDIDEDDIRHDSLDCEVPADVPLSEEGLIVTLIPGSSPLKTAPLSPVHPHTFHSMAQSTCEQFVEDALTPERLSPTFPPRLSLSPYPTTLIENEALRERNEEYSCISEQSSSLHSCSPAEGLSHSSAPRLPLVPNPMALTEHQAFCEDREEGLHYPKLIALENGRISCHEGEVYPDVSQHSSSSNTRRYDQPMEVYFDNSEDTSSIKMSSSSSPLEPIRQNMENAVTESATVSETLYLPNITQREMKKRKRCPSGSDSESDIKPRKKQRGESYIQAPVEIAFADSLKVSGTENIEVVSSSSNECPIISSKSEILDGRKEAENNREAFAPLLRLIRQSEEKRIELPRLAGMLNAQRETFELAGVKCFRNYIKAAEEAKMIKVILLFTPKQCFWIKLREKSDDSNGFIQIPVWPEGPIHLEASTFIYRRKLKFVPLVQFIKSQKKKKIRRSELEAWLETHPEVRKLLGVKNIKRYLRISEEARIININENARKGVSWVHLTNTNTVKILEMCSWSLEP